jgi:MFS family permease
MQTLFFVAQYFVFITGILSDKYGRRKTAFYLIVANGILHVLLTVLLNIKELDVETEVIVFIVIRMLTGFTANTYTVVMILAIEMCGSSRRVTVGNIIYYLYILGELLTVGLAYFFRDYDSLMIAYTTIYVAIMFYFWSVFINYNFDSAFI